MSINFLKQEHDWNDVHVDVDVENEDVHDYVVNDRRCRCSLKHSSDVDDVDDHDHVDVHDDIDYSLL